jgi:hypothetical protein
LRQSIDILIAKEVGYLGYGETITGGNKLDFITVDNSEGKRKGISQSLNQQSIFHFNLSTATTCP